MPRKPRRNATVGDWLSNQFWNTSLPWLLGLFFIGTGFYYVTNSTLDSHTKTLATLEIAIAAGKKDDEDAREKVRGEFLIDSRATAAGIAELNKQTAILATTMVGVQKELEKITARLDQSVPVRR